MLTYRSYTPEMKRKVVETLDLERIDHVTPEQVKIRKFLRAYMPTFCWQHMMEIVTMVECEYPEVNENSLRQTVCQMARAGEMETKPSPYKNLGFRGVAYMYRRRG